MIVMDRGISFGEIEGMYGLKYYLMLEEMGSGFVWKG